MSIVTKRQETSDMRSWLEDCGAEVDGRTDGEVRREVDRSYVGGVAQFRRDYAPSSPVPAMAGIPGVRVGVGGFIRGSVVA